MAGQWSSYIWVFGNYDLCSWLCNHISRCSCSCYFKNSSLFKLCERRIIMHRKKAQQKEAVITEYPLFGPNFEKISIHLLLNSRLDVQAKSTKYIYLPHIDSIALNNKRSRKCTAGECNFVVDVPLMPLSWLDLLILRRMLETLSSKLN